MINTEVFESNAIGKIEISSLQVCKGCPRFHPYASTFFKLDENKRVMKNEHDEDIIEGVFIRCENHFLCQHVARETIRRVKEGLE